MTERLDALENRITALEERTQMRQSEWEELTNGFNKAIQELCNIAKIDIPQRLKQKE